MDLHLGFLVAVLIQCSLPHALIEVIVTADETLSVKATVFLAEFLFLAYGCLPAEANTLTGCLPTLLSRVSSRDPRW